MGTIIRSAHALADATVVLGPGMRRPLFAEGRAGVDGIDLRRGRRPARRSTQLDGQKARPRRDRGARVARLDVSGPSVLVLGSERGELPEGRRTAARIPVHADSLNVAMAASVALYEVANRMAADG